ncbi:MAG: lamin tail domain-containing protein, partial [Sedimentisphaerales bacterium]|nr:lamin tail domain-containing protein [Sedimentisphaerales bacterium]
MNKLLAVFALNVLLSGFIPSERAYSAQLPLVINEFIASNSSSAQDPQGQYDDWIEIHNYGSDAIDIGGFYLTDNLSAPAKWRFPRNIPILTTIPPGGYLVIWADNDTEYSGLHTNFKLDAGGEQIALFDYDGSTLIDSVTFDEQTVDISYGRYPDAADNWQFLTSPSPSSENISVFQGFVEDVKFSHEHGFYDTPFSVTLATETKNAIIYYTLDGSEPFNISSAARSPMGITYTGPITVNGTTCLRAVAIKPGWKSSDITTRTYIFLDDVIRQSPTGQQPGPQWPISSVNGQVIDYGMDPDVVNNSKYRGVIKDALLAIPTISLVTDLDNLFDSSSGIYVNARRDGIQWERPASAELLNPDGSEGFQINAGLRIRGAFSRDSSNPKHALRLFFRNEYGAGKLRYPLFGSEGVDEFDKIDLRTSQNNSWAYQGSSQNTLIRDVFSRDVQRDMDQPYTRSRYYHLYINGQYWGIYQTQERADADFAESYLGARKEEYDVIKNDSSGSRALHATDGTIDSYRRLYDAAVAGFDSDAAYFAVQGLRPDGTHDPAGEKLLDPENLMDYMICTYYTGDPDAPVSCWAHFSNNVFAIYNRVNPQGFTWYRHDAEHSLGANGGVNESRLLTDPTDRSIGEQWRHFNPAWLHLRLTDHPEYLTKFADRVNKYFFNEGILTAEQNIQRWIDRAEQIDLAIIAESARWGDAKTHPPFTKDHWESQNNYMINTFFPRRNQIVINKMRSVNMFPDLALVSFNRHGGQALPGFKLNMSQSNGATGTIYYTLDGSEPALQTVQQGTTTSATIVTANASKRVLVPARSLDSSWRGGGVFNDSTWTLSSGSPGGIGYERSSGYQNYISLDVQAQMYNGNTSCFIRIPFTVNSDPSQYNFLTLKMRYDDGFVAYINGVEVQRTLFTGTPNWNSDADSNHEADGVESFSITDHISALRQGSNILAIHGLNVSTTSSDFLISAELIAGQRTGPTGGSGISPGAVQYTGVITLDNSTHVKARVLRDGLWGALTEATFAVGPVAENLRITEIMYNPNDPNTEYIELKNVGSGAINLNLVKLTNGIDFTFPNLELAPNEYVVVVQDRQAFETRYGTAFNIAGEYSGRLNDGGERIALEDAIGQTILDFDYKDGWRSITDGDGFSLTLIDPVNTDPFGWNDKNSWRASAYISGSPGEDDSGMVPNPGAVVINEVLAHSHADAADWIELHNTTSTAIDIGGWFLSDNNADLMKYRIAAGTIIAPDGYIVFYEDQHFNNPSAPGTNQPFALSENGEQLYLSSAEGGLLTGYRYMEDFGGSETGVSFGRFYKPSTGN